VAALCGALVTCAPASSPAPPSTAAAPAPSDPCQLASADVIASVAGVPFQAGEEHTVNLPGGSSQSTCLFRPTSPAQAPTSVAGVTLGVLARADFDRLRTFDGSPEVAVHPVVIPAADAAFETFGPNLGMVYVRRGAVCFDVDVRLVSGVDTTLEERLAEVLVALQR